MAKKPQSNTEAEAEILAPRKEAQNRNPHQKTKTDTPSPIIDMGGQNKSDGKNKTTTPRRLIFIASSVALVSGALMLGVFAPYLLQKIGMMQAPQVLMQKQLAPLIAQQQDMLKNRARIVAGLDLFDDMNHQLEAQKTALATIARLENDIIALTQTQDLLLKQQATQSNHVQVLQNHITRLAQEKPASLSVLKAAILAALTNAAHSGQPFAIELAAYRQHILSPAESALVTALAPAAKTGIRASDDLQTMFAATLASLSALLAQEKSRNDTRSLIEKLQRSLAQLIRVKTPRTDKNKNTPENILARITDLLQGNPDRQKLRAALALSQNLPAALHPTLKPWQDETRATLASTDILAQLATAIGLLPYHGHYDASSSRSFEQTSEAQ